MKFLALCLVGLLFAGGCAANRPAPSAAHIAKQRDEIEVLVEEVNLIAREFDHVRREAASKDTYLIAAQVRDLDHVILILREAKARLVAEKRRLREDYQVWIKD